MSVAIIRKRARFYERRPYQGLRPRDAECGVEDRVELLRFIDEMADALEKIEAAYRLERDALYECSTNSDGEFSDVEDANAVAEMDEILAVARAVLVKAREETA